MNISNLESKIQPTTVLSTPQGLCEAVRPAEPQPKDEFISHATFSKGKKNQVYAGGRNPATVDKFFKQNPDKPFLYNEKSGVIHHKMYLTRQSQADEAITSGKVVAYTHPAYAEHDMIEKGKNVHFSGAEKPFELKPNESVILNFGGYTRKERNDYTSFLNDCKSNKWNYAVWKPTGEIISTRYRDSRDGLVDWVARENKEDMVLAHTWEEAREKGGKDGSGNSLPKIYGPPKDGIVY